MRYRELLEKYAIPRIGEIPLQELQPIQLERMYNDLRERGGRLAKDSDGVEAPRPLSAKTVRHVHGTIHSALAKAIQWKRLEVNPADMVELPKVEDREAKAASQTEAEFILQTLMGTPLHIPALIATFTGARRGECLAVAWEHVDLDGRVLKIVRSLQQVKDQLAFKTPKGRKPGSFPIPQVLVDALRVHRAGQRQHRETFGETYRSDLDLVVCQPDGSPFYPDRFTAAFCDARPQDRKARVFVPHAAPRACVGVAREGCVGGGRVEAAGAFESCDHTEHLRPHFTHDEQRAADPMDEIFSGQHSLDQLPKQ